MYCHLFTVCLFVASVNMQHKEPNSYIVFYIKKIVMHYSKRT